MPFYFTSNQTVPMENLGAFPQFVIGSVALVGGVATVTIPQLAQVKVALAASQTANAARVSAHNGNQITISGNGSDRVDFVAFGPMRA